LGCSRPPAPSLAQFSGAWVVAAEEELLLRQVLVQFLLTVRKLSVAASALIRRPDFAKGWLVGLLLQSAFAGRQSRFGWRLICFPVPPFRSAVSRVLFELLSPCFLPPRFSLLRPPRRLRGSLILFPDVQPHRGRRSPSPNLYGVHLLCNCRPVRKSPRSPRIDRKAAAR